MNPRSVLQLLLAFCVSCPELIGAAKAPGHDTDPMNIPLFAQKGQARFALAFGQKGEGIHAMGGFALSPSLALLGAAAYADHNNCPSCRISERRHAELGFGTYAYSAQSGFHREGFAGLAKGRFKMSGESEWWDPQEGDTRTTGGDYTEFYLQTELGRAFRWQDWAIASRLAVYRFTDFSVRNGVALETSVPKDPWAVFLEPGLDYRLGYGPVKIDLQVGLSLPLVQEKELDNNKIWASLGIGVDVFAP